MTDSTSHGNRAPAIHAIQTQYAGYLFRSRLEARWAVFFDSLGVDWKYETEGFEIEDGGKKLRYLPDFYLPRSRTWVEVKGSIDHLKDDAARLERFIILDAMPNVFFKSVSPFVQGLLVLGEIPEQKWAFCLHPVYTQNGYGAVRQIWAGFRNNTLTAIPDDLPDWFLGLMEMPESTWDVDPKDWSNQHRYIGRLAHKKNIAAYDSARSARFEHGAV